MAQTLKIGFIGAGNMAEAIIGAVLTRKLCGKKSISAFEVNRDRQKFMRRKYGISFVKTLAELTTSANVLLVCVKPQQMREVLETLKPYLGKKHLIITIAAGIRTDFYSKILGKDTRLIRVMPNTPAMVGLGASGIFAAAAATQADCKLAAKIFGAAGITTKIDNEALIDAVTALSGSGPAFVYRFAAALMDGGIQAGLTPEAAKALALQTLLGAATMLVRSGDDPAELTAKVTSKGGTTLAGLDALEANGFSRVVTACILRAAERARELSEEFGT